jgi:YegS/Rv2252/BmrU family lipid kinase
MSEPKPVPREAVLIVNTRSRRGERLFREAAAKLEAAGIRLIAKHGVKKPGKDLIRTMKAAVKSGAPMVIVGGGDGSLSCTVDEVVDRDCVFALLPLGTANSFARTLGIPTDLDGAIDVIATGRRRRIDVGAIDGDYFANGSSIGLSPIIAKTIPHKLKRYLGRPGYLMWSIWCLTRFKSFDLEVEGPDGRQRLRALEVRILNGRYHGGIEVAADTEIDDGVIVVEAVHGHARTTLAKNWLRLLLGLPRKHGEVRRFEAPSLRLATNPPLPISIDGEVLAHTPATASVAKCAIEVVVPKSSPERGGGSAKR